MVSKRKIKFHDKEMSLFGAKLYLLGINYGLIGVSLDINEKAGYSNEKEREKERGIIAKKYLGQESVNKAIPRLNEKRYLVGILERKIKAEEQLRKVEYCNEHGHKKGEPFKSWMANKEIPSYICSRCNAIYEEGTNNIVIHPFESPTDK